jgi:dihydrofolate synthase/folylpolyglutamate synthase
MRDKAISEMTEILFPLAERVIATRPENPRAAPPEEIRQAAARTGVEIEAVENVELALARARSLARAGTVVVITGSIYLVGEVMRIVSAES